MLILALVMVRYLSMVVPVPTKPAMAAVFVLFFLANYAGVGLAARLQVILMGALVVLFLIFAAWGAPAVQAEHFAPFMPEGTAGMLAAVPLLIGLFFGIEAATEIGDEVKDGQKNIPLGIALSIGSAVGLYLLVAVVALGVLGPEALGESETPLLDAAIPFMGPVAKPLIVTAAVVAICKSINSLYLGFSRSLFAMARAGMLPSALAAVHPKHGTPHWALATILVAALLGLFAPMNLTSLFLAVNIPTLVKYAATCFSAVVVVRKHPQIYQAARFRMSPGATVGWAYAGAFAALVVAALGFQADWKPYAALGVWALIGIAYYAVQGRKAA
jgi:APA family basic amino acid/polyamine antiporter